MLIFGKEDDDFSKAKGTNRMIGIHFGSSPDKIQLCYVTSHKYHIMERGCFCYSSELLSHILVIINTLVSSGSIEG